MDVGMLTIKSRTENLDRARNFVSTAAVEFGFDDDTVNGIALAVDEACSNVIKHAYNFAPDKDIQIRVGAEEGRFEIVITDNGKSFRPEPVTIKDVREQILHRRKGGLGVYLMHRMMDVVEYNVVPDKKNEVRLVKYRTRTAHIH